MSSSTVKTMAGFCRAFIIRRVPFMQESVVVEGIYNYLLIDNLFATSGQPSEAQFASIHAAGYQTVINLAPNSVLENAVVNEQEILAKLGMKYIHIPVDFKKPTEGDFATFVDSLQQNADSRIWVHCAANMRVSAFTYRYRCAVLGVQASVAADDLRKIWAPIGVWKKFIQR